MCVHFFNFDHLRITLQSSNLIWGTKFRAPSLPLPPIIFSYLQALIHDFLWWWAFSWLILSLKWHLQLSLFHLHSTFIDLQEVKDSIDEEDPRPTSSTWSYISLKGRVSDNTKENFLYIKYMEEGLYTNKPPLFRGINYDYLKERMIVLITIGRGGKRKLYSI